MINSHSFEKPNVLNTNSFAKSESPKVFVYSFFSKKY